MSVVSTSLRRPVTVIVCTIAIVVFGLMVYTQLSMQDMPDTDAPVVSVSTTMTGASATVMDNDVTDVIEEQLNSISGVSSLSSSSYQGKAVTVVEFDMNRDIDAAAADVRDKVNLAAGTCRMRLTRQSSASSTWETTPFCSWPSPVPLHTARRSTT